MSLVFLALIREVDGHLEAETPALPGWSAAGAEVGRLLGHARAALESALDALPLYIPPIGAISADVRLYRVVLEEPERWFAKPPSE